MKAIKLIRSRQKANRKSHRHNKTQKVLKVPVLIQRLKQMMVRTRRSEMKLLEIGYMPKINLKRRYQQIKINLKVMKEMHKSKTRRQKKRLKMLKKSMQVIKRTKNCN